MIALLVLLLIALVDPSLGSFWNQGSFWDQKSDNCYYALRHRGTPSVDMFLKMQQWGTTDIWKGLELDEHDCHAYFDGCQTYSCVDENGDQIFVVNSCVPDSGKCTNSDLDSICTKDGGTPKCEICYNGLCNKAKIELKKPLLKNVQKPNNPPETGTGGAKNESSFEQNGMMTGAKNESSSEENGTGGAKNESSFEQNGMMTGAKNESSFEENGTTTGAKNESSFEKNAMMTGAKNESSFEENGTTTGAKNESSFEKNVMMTGAKNESSFEENGMMTGAKDESSSTPAE